MHIRDINAVSVGTTLQPAGLEASKGVISVNYSKHPLDPSWQDNPRHEEIFRFMAKSYADGDKACDRARLVTSKLTHNRQVQACKKRRIRRPTSEMWFRVGRLPIDRQFSRSMLVASAVAADGRESTRCWPGSCFDRVVLT